MGVSIGVDIGGTKVLAGAVDADGVVLGSVRLATPGRSTSPQVVESTIVEAVTSLETSLGVEADVMGIGAAGFVDAKGTIAFSPHLSWRDEPLAEALSTRLRRPVVVDNDANTTAWAEVRFGAARPFRHVLCLTLGTGIGGAIVTDRAVFRGANGMAGEFGHMQVVPGGHRCECGNRGCWEQYSSGNALVRQARELVVACSPASQQLRELVEDDPAWLTGPLVTQAARDGDDSAVGLLREIGDWLGVGLAGLVAAFDPEAVVIGGGVSDADELLLGPARFALARTLTGRGFRPVPPVLRAALGPEAGFIGAADLARELVGHR
jgi:glucokinase